MKIKILLTFSLYTLVSPPVLFMSSFQAAICCLVSNSYVSIATRPFMDGDSQ